MDGYTYPEAAAKLRVSEAALRRNIKALPHHKFGRQVVFYDDDLALIRDSWAIRPDEPAPAIAGPVLQALADLTPKGGRRRRG